jgi:hypothetical protein
MLALVMAHMKLAIIKRMKSARAACLLYSLHVHIQSGVYMRSAGSVFRPH